MRPLTAVVVGAGHRSLAYASFARNNPEQLKIVGVADPLEYRRREVASLYGFDDSCCFETAEALAARGRMADCVINGTMDRQHVPTSVPLLEAGYDLLLEKPFAVNEREMWDLVRTARTHGRTVAICHVLRYAPFYAAIRREVAAGTIGKIINIQTVEHVSYHHMSVAFVRGKWNREDVCGSSMLMSKCCHDLDLIMWMKSGTRPVSVFSYGSNVQFTEENAPPGAGTRCLVDCPIESECLYSARKLYLDHPKRWAFYVWDLLEEVEDPTDEDREALLRDVSPHGRCAWKCDNTVVDHQSVVIEFADGATATHNMVGGSSKPSRSIHLIGTTGEIQGVMEDSTYVVRHIDPSPGSEYREKAVDLAVGGDMHGTFGGHGGGDLRLVGDFLNLVRGGETSISSTTLDDSVYGHLTGFLADKAMQTRTVQPIPSVGARTGPDHTGPDHTGRDHEEDAT